MFTNINSKISFCKRYSYMCLHPFIYLSITNVWYIYFPKKIRNKSFIDMTDDVHTMYIRCK